MSIPGWVGTPSVLWVTDCDPDPSAPLGATRVGPEQAMAWAHAGDLPAMLRTLRARGGTVASPPHLRRVARHLRARLAVATARTLADVANDLDLPSLAAALATWPDGTPLTPANLAAAAPSPAARLLHALEHL